MTAIAHSENRLKTQAENWVGGYYTFGEYDLILIVETPNDKVVISLTLKVGPYGNVRTKTSKAFTAEEEMRIIKDLP